MATDETDTQEIAGPGAACVETAHGQPLLFSADQFERMAEVGVLHRRGVDLLDGRLFVTRPLGGLNDTPDQPFRFCVPDYYRIWEAGVLPRGRRVELIDGSIRLMSPIGNRHAACVDRLMRWLVVAVGARGHVRVQGPVRLGDRSEPEPDLTVARARHDDYASGHPGPSEIFWLIEVMESTSGYDRGEKLAVYAREGVAEVWLVDLRRDRVEAYRSPVGGVYAERTDHRPGQSLATGAFPDLVLDVDAILGGREGER